MAINQLIARGLSPIGRDLPEVGNMLQQMKQRQVQNALAERNLAIGEQNAGTSYVNAMTNAARQQADMDAATREQVGNALDNLDAVADPAQRAQVAQAYAAHPLAKQFQVTPDELMQPGTPALRARLGLQAPKPRDVGPLETVDEGGVPILRPRAEAIGKQGYVKPAPSTNVTIGAPAVEPEANKVYAKVLGEEFSDVVKQGRAAGDTLDQLRAVRASPAITGPGADAVAGITQTLAAIGVPVSERALTNAANVRQLGAMVGGVVLAKQIEQVGPQTDSDRKAIKETLAQTSDVKVVRDAVIDFQIALAERKQMRADFYKAYRSRTGKIEGAEDDWNKFSRSTPLVTTNPKNNRLVFFHNFREVYLQGNPSATDEEVLTEWRGVSGGRK